MGVSDTYELNENLFSLGVTEELSLPQEARDELTLKEFSDD